MFDRGLQDRARLVPIIEELRAGFDARRYQGPQYPLSAAQVAFRNVLLPMMRLRRSGRNVLMFLDRAMFADDWKTEEGDLASPERRGWRVSDRLLMIDATIGALRYLQTATAAVKTAYGWGDFPHSLLRGDLRTMYRVQLDPRNNETRERLIRAAQDLAELTAEQTRRVIRQQFPAEWKRVGETGGADVTRAWQAEAVAIVEEYDDAVNGPGW